MDLWGIVAVTLLLFLAFIGGLGVEHFKGPALVGEIAVGALLGPHCLGVVTEKYAEGLALLGDMGLLLLVFEGGLTMDIEMLKSVGAKAFLVAFSGTLLPVLMGWGLMSALGFHAIEAFASGTALSATAIGFALRLLQDLDLVKTPQGQLITAAAMIDDVLSLLVLAVLKAVHEEPSAWHFVRPVLASLVVFGLGLLLRTVAASKMEDVHAQKALLELPSWQPFCMMVFLALTMSFAANLFYSTTLLGTFMAGLICGAIPVAKVTWDSSSLPDHIIPWAVRLFFAASVGFSIPVYALFHGPAIKFGLVLTVAAFAGKFASGVFGMMPPDPWLSAIQVGCAMIGRGELGFMMASESLESGLLGDTAFSATVWALTLATIGGPILFQKAVKLSHDPKATTYGVYAVTEARL
mmetsp:Transcript_30693/g.59193  ORF Transcript_30693/g.59193 Transcript_30693/m.59193 type:complete len:409 (-) Transcript_30693:409-1635(-)